MWPLLDSNLIRIAQTRQFLETSGFFGLFNNFLVMYLFSPSSCCRIAFKCPLFGAIHHAFSVRFPNCFRLFSALVFLYIRILCFQIYWNNSHGRKSGM